MKLMFILAALNWPTHRGTATAFPMGGFGLSAFLFSAISSLVFPDNTSGFLLLLSVGTFTLVSVSCFFLRTINHPQSYTALPGQENHLRYDSNRLRSSKSFERRYSVEGDSYNSVRRNSGAQHQHGPHGPSTGPVHDAPEDSKRDRDEALSLLSETLESRGSTITKLGQDRRRRKSKDDLSHQLDIRGVTLLSRMEFWQLFSLMGLLAGIGLMTIKFVPSVILMVLLFTDWVVVISETM